MEASAASSFRMDITYAGEVHNSGVLGLGLGAGHRVRARGILVEARRKWGVLQVTCTAFMDEGPR